MKQYLQRWSCDLDSFTGVTKQSLVAMVKFKRQAITYANDNQMWQRLLSIFVFVNCKKIYAPQELLFLTAEYVCNMM